MYHLAKIYKACGSTYVMEIEVIYEKGVFKPLKKIDLKEGTCLTFIMGKDKVKKVLQNLKTLEPLDVEIDDETLEWEYYAEP